MTLGGGERADVSIGPYKGGSYGEAAKPLRPCCARPAPHFVRSLFARAKPA